MGTILLSTVYLKHSSSSLLDLTRAEWFLPGRGPELLWQELFLKIQCKRWKTVSSGISFSRITRNTSSCPGRASSATVGLATDLLAGPEGGKLMRGVQHSATAPRCASSHYWPGILFSCPSSSRPTLDIYILTVLHIHCVGFKAFRPSRPNRNLAKPMGVIRKHDLTKKSKEHRQIQIQKQIQW